MSESPRKKQDFLEFARHEFAQISAELEKTLEALKDPERRKQVTSSYLDMLQKALSKAQGSVAKYQQRVAPHTPTGVPEDGTPAGMSPVVEPMPAASESEPEPPTT